MTQHPILGYNIRPKTEKATGTSLLHGKAAFATRQHAWHWPLTTEQPSTSGLIPTHPNGKRHGALGLQQHSTLQQQTPAYNSVSGRVPVSD